MEPFIGGAFIAFLGIYFAKSSIKNFKNFELSKKWPSVTGVVTKSSVWRPKSTSAHHVWSIEYIYSVNGKDYQGTRAALYTPLYEEIINWQQDRQEGDKTDVFYNPANPAESVLVTGGRDEKKYGEIILSVAVTLFGLAIMVAGYLGYLN